MVSAAAGARPSPLCARKAADLQNRSALLAESIQSPPDCRRSGPSEPQNPLRRAAIETFGYTICGGQESEKGILVQLSCNEDSCSVLNSEKRFRWHLMRDRTEGCHRGVSKKPERGDDHVQT